MIKDIKKRYVGIKELATYTSLTVSTLYEWAGSGRIPSIKYGRRVLFDLHDVDQIMQSLKRSTNQGEKTANKILGDIHANNI
ncbi:MAG: helix-turn-helix transcriptional regulator [Candidatus Anammoxibacter sp.]